MPVALLVFDCDGVLVDSEDISSDVLIDLCAPLGIVLDRAHVRAHYIGRSFPTVARALADLADGPLPPTFEQTYRTALLRRFEGELRPTPGVADILAATAIRRCVATSSSPQRVERSLAVTGLATFFGPHVFTASEVARGKPHPDLFLHAAARMGADPAATLVIEDSRPGFEAALAAGMRVVAYTGGAHLRGRPFDGPQGIAAFDNWAEFPHLLSSLTQGWP